MRQNISQAIGRGLDQVANRHTPLPPRGLYRSSTGHRTPSHHAMDGPSRPTPKPHLDSTDGLDGTGHHGTQGTTDQKVGGSIPSGRATGALGDLAACAAVVRGFGLVVGCAVKGSSPSGRASESRLCLALHVAGLPQVNGLVLLSVGVLDRTLPLYRICTRRRLGVVLAPPGLGGRLVVLVRPAMPSRLPGWTTTARRMSPQLEGGAALRLSPSFGSTSSREPDADSGWVRRLRRGRSRVSIRRTEHARRIFGELLATYCRLHYLL
jgi:hypothetical protein